MGVRGRDRQVFGEHGLTLVEVMMASIVVGIGLAGGVALLHWAEHGRQFGAQGTRALALATSRLEVKRVASWERLLVDVSEDGRSERAMADDGRDPDTTAGDGIYSGAADADGIRVVWSIQPSHPGRLRESGHVTIQASARYRTMSGAMREVRVGTIRGNPRFIGPS